MLERLAQSHEAAAFSIQQSIDQPINQLYLLSWILVRESSTDNKQETKSQMQPRMLDHMPLPFPYRP